MTVGSDVPNGFYAMLGARQGCYKTNCTDWDFTNVRDFKYLNNLYEEIVSDFTLDNDLTHLGNEIESRLKIPCPSPLTPGQSIFFKTVYTNPPRMKNNLVIA
jgi:hypothetical protein